MGLNYESKPTRYHKSPSSKFSDVIILDYCGRREVRTDV